MKFTSIGAAALCAALSWAGTAQARNPHCAGGIQYWQQWKADKDKGNLDDYRRELTKSIQQLEQCAAEDPKDFEALGYLGWCYAEAESCAASGRAFAKALEGLTAKGDKKGAERVATNRDSYWVTAFNDGIAKIKSAQELFPEFCNKPQNAEEETRKAEAAKKYEAAIASLTCAMLIRRDDARALQNIGTVHAFRCEYSEAEETFTEALKLTQDAELTKALKGSLQAVRTNIANRFIRDKKYDEAIAFFGDLVKADPNNPELQIGLGEALFERAQSREGDPRKQDFKAAGDAYTKAAESKPDDADILFNAAASYENAGENALSETAWRAVLKARPNDSRALQHLGSVLAELGKFDESIKVLHQAVVAEPKDKSLHRQLGTAYTKAGNNEKATQELMVYLALDHGQPVADPAAEAKKSIGGAQAAKTLTSMGVPEQIYPWVAEGEKWESWFYWSKKVAMHFKGGVLAQKSDWSAPDLKTASSGSGK